MENPAWAEYLKMYPTPVRGRYHIFEPFDPVGYVKRATDRYKTREEFVRRYSWAVPAPHTIRLIVDNLENNKLLEAGAGTGYWSWMLAQHGVDVLAFDNVKIEENHYIDKEIVKLHYHEVKIGEMEEWVPQNTDRTLFLCWPNYNTPFAHDCLKLYQENGGKKVVFIGEGEGGCTGDDAFFSLLERDWELELIDDIYQWDHLNDRITIHKLKESNAKVHSQ